MSCYIMLWSVVDYDDRWRGSGIEGSGWMGILCVWGMDRIEVGSMEDGGLGLVYVGTYGGGGRKTTQDGRNETGF